MFGNCDKSHLGTISLFPNSVTSVSDFFTVMMKLIPDPRSQGEGDEGGEEGALAGAVR